MGLVVDINVDSGIDPQAFRQAMGSFATGVAIVTTAHDGEWFGMTVNSLTSVSLDPCLLLVCPRRGSATGNAIRLSGQFAISLLSHDQQALATRFVGRSGTMADRFAGVDLAVSSRGLPVLRDALSNFECEVHSLSEGGDHDVVMGKVVACQLQAGDPLVFYRGSFGNFTTSS